MAHKTPDRFSKHYNTMGASSTYRSLKRKPSSSGSNNGDHGAAIATISRSSGGGAMPAMQPSHCQYSKTGWQIFHVSPSNQISKQIDSARLNTKSDFSSLGVHSSDGRLATQREENQATGRAACRYVNVEDDELVKCHMSSSSSLPSEPERVAKADKSSSSLAETSVSLSLILS